MAMDGSAPPQTTLECMPSWPDYCNYRVEFTDYNGTYVDEYYDNKPSWTRPTGRRDRGDYYPNINAALSVAGHITGVVTAKVAVRS